MRHCTGCGRGVEYCWCESLNAMKFTALEVELLLELESEVRAVGMGDRSRRVPHVLVELDGVRARRDALRESRRR